MADHRSRRIGSRHPLTFSERLALADADRDHVAWLREQGLYDEVVSAISGGALAYRVFKLLRSDYDYPFAYSTIKALATDHAAPSEEGGQA